MFMTFADGNFTKDFPHAVELFQGKIVCLICTHFKELQLLPKG